MVLYAIAILFLLPILSLVFGSQRNYNDLPEDVFEVREGFRYNGAHNTILDLAYRCGVPAGLMMLAIVAFLMESLLEIQVMPSDRDITFFFFISSFVVLNSPQIEWNREWNNYE